MNPTQELEAEHNAILAALRILNALVQQMLAETAVPPDDVAELLGFLKEFADKCHHGKEEGALFPALLKADDNLREPVLIMLAEHAEGRRLVRAMEAAFVPPVRREEFVSAAKDYIRLLQAHIEKENRFLFQTTNRLLTGPELEAIADEFEAFEKKVIGHERHEQLHRLLETLKAKYGQPTLTCF